MKLLKINQAYLDTTAGFLIEYRNKPYKSIRLLFHEASTIDKHIIQQAKYFEELEELSDPNHWIQFESFYQLVKDKTIANLDEACGRKVTQCVTSEDDSKVPLQRTVTNSNISDTLSDHYIISLASSVTSLWNIVMDLLVTVLLIS
ncbi:Cytochrome P450 2E1 [Dirofilaria immitis]